jgi:hypothetical protein
MLLQSVTAFCIHAFRVILTVNSCYFLNQLQPVDLCIGEVLFFLCATEGILKYYLHVLRLLCSICHKFCITVAVMRVEIGDSIFS